MTANQPTMLTRSHARALARSEAAARAAGNMAVSPSNTGKGTHIRWTYPEENDKRSEHPSTHTHTHTRTRYKVDHTATYLIGSCSSISSEGYSSEEPLLVTPNSSFDTPTSLLPVPVTPQRNNRPPTTPPRLSPKKLQRSPQGRWITENGTTRIVFMEESEAQVKFREMQNEIKYQRIEERELEILLRERDIANGGKDEDFGMDVETQTSGTWRDQASSADDISEATGLAPAAYIRGDTEPLEEIPLPRRVRPLGPNGTELVDPVTFMPYSMDCESFEASRIETWRQGVL